MTDKEKLESLFSEFGIPFHGRDEYGREGVILLADDQDESDKVEGYYRFLTAFTFDTSGKFLKVGIWE